MRKINGHITQRKKMKILKAGNINFYGHSTCNDVYRVTHRIARLEILGRVKYNFIVGAIIVMSTVCSAFSNLMKHS